MSGNIHFTLKVDENKQRPSLKAQMVGFYLVVKWNKLPQQTFKVKWEWIKQQPSHLEAKVKQVSSCAALQKILSYSKTSPSL